MDTNDRTRSSRQTGESRRGFVPHWTSSPSGTSFVAATSSAQRCRTVASYPHADGQSKRIAGVLQS